MNNENKVVSVGDNIKNFRTWRGITQQGLADQLQKSKSVISNWEHGTNSPDVESCKGICKLLGVTPNQLLGWEENEDYKKFIEDQKEYEEELENLRSQAAALHEQIKNLEQKKEDKVPRPSKDIWALFGNTDDDIPFH